MSEETDTLGRLEVGTKYNLMDGENRILGTVVVREIEDIMVTGDFVPAPAYSVVRDLFAGHAAVIDHLLMAKEVEYHHKIENLGLHLSTPEGKPGPLIHNIIIRDGSEIFFHLRWGYPAEFKDLHG